MARMYPFLSSYDILLRIQIYLSINFKKFGGKIYYYFSI